MCALKYKGIYSKVLILEDEDENQLKTTVRKNIRRTHVNGVEKGSDDLSRQQWSTKWMSEYIFEYELLNAWIFVTKEILCTKTDLSVYPDIWSHFKRFSGMYATFAHFHIEFGVTSCFSHFWWVLIVIIKEKKKQHSPLLQTLLSSSIGPLESLSSSCRCKWLCWLKWWWFRPRLWCKWCRWLLLLFAADALKSRGLSGDGERPPFSTCSRLRWSAAPAASTTQNIGNHKTWSWR